MKLWAESQLDAGVKTVVVDLETCTGMDSTFMGTMAGIAMRLAKLPDAKLQVASANDKSRSSLEDLGLSSLIEINPPEAEWSSNLESIRESLKASCATSVDQTQHVFDAHKQLCDADSSNDEAREFIVNLGGIKALNSVSIDNINMIYQGEQYMKMLGIGEVV